MKGEVGSVKGERGRGLGVSNFALLTSHFFSAIKKNFEELGV